MSQLGEPLPAFAELQELNRAIPVALAHFRPESRGSRCAESLQSLATSSPAPCPGSCYGRSLPTDVLIGDRVTGLSDNGQSRQAGEGQKHQYAVLRPRSGTVCRAWMGPLALLMIPWGLALRAAPARTPRVNCDGSSIASVKPVLRGVSAPAAGIPRTSWLPCPYPPARSALQSLPPRRPSD